MDIDYYLGEYAKRFDDGFPMYPLGFGRTNTEIIDIIKKCLETGQDVYEMGLVSDDLDLEY